jgi:hypothetical protein
LSTTFAGQNTHQFNANYLLHNSQILPKALHPSQNDALQSGGNGMSSDQLGTLEKAREELRKQFFGYAESLAKGFQRAQT